MKLPFFAVLLWLNGCFNNTSPAQSVDQSAFIEVVLPDSQIVQLYPSIDMLHGYYYVPTNLRLSTNDENSPEFLCMMYKSGEGTTQQLKGVLHWLLTWGVTKYQQDYMTNRIQERFDSNAVILGALYIESSDYFRIIGVHSDLVECLNKAKESGGRSINASDQKSAFAFNLSGKCAEKIAEIARAQTMIDGVFIEMDYYIPSINAKQTLTLALSKIFASARKCNECFIFSE